jgi:hypothetical protein
MQRKPATLRQRAQRYRRMQEEVPEERAKAVLADVADEAEWQAKAAEADPVAELPPPPWRDF